jgi:hypothetical protein
LIFAEAGADMLGIRSCNEGEIAAVTANA